MKSRITIEVDFENSNQPQIQIIQVHSDDVRDKLLASFCQQFGGSSWCNIKWDPNPSGLSDMRSNEFNRILITPIAQSQFKEQAIIMLKQKWANERFSSGDSLRGRPSNRLDLMSDAERMIQLALAEVESIGAAEELTSASIKLMDAAYLVYQYFSKEKK